MSIPPPPPPPPPPPGVTVVSSVPTPPPGVPLPPGVPPPSGVPRPPGPGFPPMKTKPNRKPKVPMKILDWTKLNANDIKGTIWDKIDDAKIKFNPDDFCETFSKAEAKPKAAADAKSKEQKNVKKAFVDPDRQKIIDIVLSKIKLKPIVISDALLYLMKKY